MPPELRQLHDRLKRIGAVVVMHKEYLEVRLSLLCSVRVTINPDGSVALAPYFGAIPRTRAIIASGVMTAVVVAAVVSAGGLTPMPLFIVLLALLSRGYEVMRFVATESCMTKVQLVASTLLDSVAGPVSLGRTPPGALGAGEAQGVYERRPVRVAESPK